MLRIIAVRHKYLEAYWAASYSIILFRRRLIS